MSGHNLKWCYLSPDSVAGHDVHDSTTLTESHTPFNIQENLDLSKLHIGIPKVKLKILL